MTLLILMLLPMIVVSEEIHIPDAKCFDQYTTDLVRLSRELNHESKREFNLQLTAIENALGLPKSRNLYRPPLAIPICSLIEPPSNYTLTVYNVANKLHFEKINTQLANNRVVYRLLQIQKKILEGR